MLIRAGFVVCVGLVLAGCGSSPALTTAPRRSPPEAAEPAAPPDWAPAPEPPPPVTAEPPERVLLVTEPAVLAALEQDVAAFWRPFRSDEAGAPASTRELASDPYFRSVVRLVREDIRRAQERDAHAGVGMRNAHRLLDPSWLISPKTRFELIGVVNRIDRRYFAPEHCGETRLVYRLAYRTRVREQPVESRLPITLNVVFWQQRISCSSCASTATTRSDAHLRTPRAPALISVARCVNAGLS